MILRDIRDALRFARRQFFLTVVIVLTLGVGIGASTAMFTYFADLYWHRVKSPDADRLYQVFTGTTEHPLGQTSYLGAQLYHEALEDMGELAPWADGYTVVLTVPQEGSDFGETILSTGSAVSPGHFDFFGVRFTQGRDFLAQEHQVAGPRAAVISHTFWRRHLEADPKAIGSVLGLNGQTFTVVGVAPRGFENMGNPHPIYVPAIRYDDLVEAPIVASSMARRFQCLLRLKEGVRAHWPLCLVWCSPRRVG